MEYRKIERKDIEKFINHRLEFVKSVRRIDCVEEFKNKTKRYLKENIDSENLIIYIGIEKEEIIASCMICIFETIPLPSNLSGKCGELLNVYTKKDARGKGYSTKLLNLAIIEAKERNVSKIILTYTDEGYNLYRKLGFKVKKREMELRL